MKKCVVGAVLALSISATPGYADCDGLEPQKRQVCLLVAEKQREDAVNGKWIIAETEKDRLTDELSTSAFLYALSANVVRPRSIMEAKDQVFLALSCKGKLGSAAVIFGYGHTVVTRSAAITYRIDDQKAVSGRLRPSVTGNAVGLWQTADAASFGRDIARGRRLIVRAVDPHLGFSEADFNISNTSDGLKNQPCFKRADKPLR